MPKNIIICCDGTGNEYGQNKTNVVRLFDVIEKVPGKQIGYYDPGVGTMSAHGAITLTAKFLTKLYGLAFAYGITNNIEDAYEYLMDKYEDGDQVYLFGFSRGAFTVRALAGMLYKCGLLQKGSNNLIKYASRMYRYGEDEDAEGFKKTFSRECKPHFIGVWDTVKSVGLFRRRRFPNSRLNPDVGAGRHAIAIDEKRSKFRPNLWEEDPQHKQDIKQVWFAGVHSDIGGWYKDEDGLPNIALKWMAKEAESMGLHVNNSALAEYKPNHKDKLHNSLIPIWWILLWWKRKIPKGSMVHKSVENRIHDKNETNYEPKNLKNIKNMIIVN